MKRRDWLLLVVLTFAGLLIHGYHPGAEDSETYLPGVEKMLHPQLFPVGSPYFLLHSHLTFFPNLIAGSIRLTHLPLAWALLLWHLLSIFLFLLACLSLMRRAFTDEIAQWCGLAVMTALLTLQASGTALYIMDQYVNPRNLTAFAVIFAVVRVLEKKYFQAGWFLVFAAALHPFMTVFAASFCALLAWMGRLAKARSPELSLGALSWSPDLFRRPSAAYQRVAGTHTYQFLLQWRWYEFLGAIAPLAILYWFCIMARARKLRDLDLMCRALIVYSAIYFVAALVISIPDRLETLCRLQPMRSLYLEYILFFLFAGGFLGQLLLKKHVWRWMLLFVPLCAGMFAAQRVLFPASAHVEWPWAEPRNPWVQGFRWVAKNTPNDAIFALDPYYMHVDGEDENGFRAIAMRSQLADAVKDSGVVEMFPQIGDEWLKEVDAQTGLDRFETNDFAQLRSKYGVGWVILRQPSSVTLICPYENQAVRVCQLGPS